MKVNYFCFQMKTNRDHPLCFLGNYLFIILFIIVLLPSVGYSQKRAGFFNSALHSEFNLLPVPQKVSFTGQNFLFNDSWSVEVPANIPENDPAVLSLTSELKKRFGIRLMRSGRNGARSIQLIVKPGSVIIGQTTRNLQIMPKHIMWNWFRIWMLRHIYPLF